MLSREATVRSHRTRSVSEKHRRETTSSSGSASSSRLTANPSTGGRYPAGIGESRALPQGDDPPRRPKRRYFFDVHAKRGLEIGSRRKPSILALVAAVRGMATSGTLAASSKAICWASA